MPLNGHQHVQASTSCHLGLKAFQSVFIYWLTPNPPGNQHFLRAHYVPDIHENMKCMKYEIAASLDQ